MPVGQMPAGRAIVYGPEHQTETQGRASLNVWSAQARASAGDNTGQNTDKGHTPNPRIGIKIPDPAGTRTRAAGLEGRDATDHVTATDHCILHLTKLL